MQHADSFRTRHLTELFLSLYSSSARTTPPNTRGFVLIAAAPSTAALHPLIGTAHIFEEVVNIKPPNKNARRDVRIYIRTDKRDTDSPVIRFWQGLFRIAWTQLRIYNRILTHRSTTQRLLRRLKVTRPRIYKIWWPEPFIA